LQSDAALRILMLRGPSAATLQDDRPQRCAPSIAFPQRWSAQLSASLLAGSQWLRALREIPFRQRCVIDLFLKLIQRVSKKYEKQFLLIEVGIGIFVMHLLFFL